MMPNGTLEFIDIHQPADLSVDWARFYLISDKYLASSLISASLTRCITPLIAAAFPLARAPLLTSRLRFSAYFAFCPAGLGYSGVNGFFAHLPCQANQLRASLYALQSARAGAA